jgi:hypothetical protein
LNTPNSFSRDGGCVNRDAECKEFLGGRSLFFVGEFGVNDYHLSLKKWSVEQVRSLVPLVIETISAAIEVINQAVLCSSH